MKNVRKCTVVGSPARNRGFSLIVTITLMVLLAMIAVGLLSLSSISVRSADAFRPQVEARSNARLAAMLALGELQKLSGSDTRVTASARLLDATNAEVSGVWRSWEGSDHDGSGKPTAPDYDAKFDAGDPSQAVASSQAGRFLGWLTSSTVGQELDSSEVPGTSRTPGNGLVKMVSGGSVSDDNEVHIAPTPLRSDEAVAEGAFSWWVSGDNTKALVNVASSERASEASEWQERLRGNLLPDAEVFGLSELDNLTDEEALIVSRRSLDLVPGASRKGEGYHDLTTYSRGLLTNVATGGWRKDLSIFSEFYTRMPRSGLPLFNSRPGEALKYGRAESRSRPGNALLYHWADYLNSSSAESWRQAPPICSWTALVNYMTLYKSLRSSSPSSVVMNPTSGSISGQGTTGRYEYMEEIRIHPQVARIQWVLSMGALSEGTEAIPGIVLTPIVTLWNPYNISMSLGGYSITFDEVFPLRLSYEVSGVSYNNISLRKIINNKISLTFPTLRLGPGESKVFGTTSSSPSENTGRQAIALSEGYRPNGGAIFTKLEPDLTDPTKNNVKELVVSPNDDFGITRVEFAAESLEGTGSEEAFGVRFEVSSSVGSRVEIHTLSYGIEDFGGQAVVDTLYPPITEPLPVKVGSVVGNRNVPFATATLGLRMVSPPPTDERFDNIRTKGMLHANPLQHHAEVGAGNDSNALRNMGDAGVYHSANAPYDFVIQEAQGWNDSAVTVEYERSTRRGYIVTGNRSTNGLSRCVLAELPTRPLQSLADLQHFDARNNNHFPPFQFNLIGNASAHPVFAPDRIDADTSGTYATMANDDSYLLNHALFDDWFVSSIAPDQEDFSRRSERRIDQVFEEFLEGEEELANRFYRPSKYAKEQTTSALVDQYLSGRLDRNIGRFPFEIVASLMEVEGMFNINSVSVDAWKAVLKRTRDVEVPYFTSRGSVTTEKSESPAFPRTTVASDVSTTGESEIGGDNDDAAVAGGYMAMTDAQIDALAEEIVDQVKKRGPFLSLSEFVNRRLSSSETNLALAGTIQKALDNLSQSSSSSTNPFYRLQQLGQEVTRIPPGNTGYSFPEAALGSTNFGVPGWVRQADILRSLAPIMSARDDTFTIRAYGDSRDNSGAIVAQAWCEMVVQRTADYVDEADSPIVQPQSTAMTSEVNRRFGRRFQIVSFRWLNEREV